MHSRLWYVLALIPGGLLLAAAAGPGASKTPELAGRAAFVDARNPPPWIEMPAAAKRDFDLGQTIFNSPWFVAGQPDAVRRDGLGPLFVQPSCNACHANGARGRPPAARGQLSNSFVMQLGGEPTVYGHVLNTRSIEGHAPEGRIAVTLHQRSGRYADGSRWTISEPRYAIENPASGPLPDGTVLRPRIGPALFGAGLIDAVPQTAVGEIRKSQPLRLRGSAGGRFGWQGDAISLVDQTALAFAREMGITSELQPGDDCTSAQRACRDAPHGGTPEISDQFFHAVTTFQFMLAAPSRSRIDPAADAAGAALFDRVGCAACHVPELPVPREGHDAIRIDPYTDLLLHDLGEGLADRTAAGRPVTSRWRTAPLWGLAHALQAGPVALLHDGRAASIEEAILWHDGQAAAARRRFLRLDAGSRQQLLDWVSSL